LLVAKSYNSLMDDVQPSGSKKRLILAVVVLLVCGLGITAAAHWSAGLDKPADTSMGLSACVPRQTDDRELISCIAKVVTAQLKEDPNPASLIPKFDREVSRRGGQWPNDCHPAMHLTGSDWAKSHHVTLINLQEYLPRSNSNNCSAGFAHGMISVLGLNPAKAVAMMKSVCAKTESRAIQFACIHGIGHGLRRTMGSPSVALKGCAALPAAAVSDCAQGIYHDFFMAVLEAPDVNKPLGTNKVVLKDLIGKNKIRKESSKLDQFCLTQPKQFLKECWYRLAAGPGLTVNVSSASDISFTCGGLSEPQHGACITGLSTARLPPKKIVAACRGLIETSVQDSVRCISGLDLLSVGWSAPAKGPARYHDEDVPGIIKECLSMKSAAPQKACIKYTALFSLRTIPDNATEAKALSVCRELQGSPLMQCQSVLRKALKDTEQLSSTIR
jgi:hypothetical protein